MELTENLNNGTKQPNVEGNTVETTVDEKPSEVVTAEIIADIAAIVGITNNESEPVEPPKMVETVEMTVELLPESVKILEDEYHHWGVDNANDFLITLINGRKQLWLSLNGNPSVLAAEKAEIPFETVETTETPQEVEVVEANYYPPKTPTKTPDNGGSGWMVLFFGLLVLIIIWLLFFAKKDDKPKLGAKITDALPPVKGGLDISGLE